MNKAYYAIAALILLAGIWISYQIDDGGVQSTNISPLSYLNNEAEVADKIMAVLSDKIKDYPIVYFGVYPDSTEDMLILMEALSVIQNDPGLKFDHFIIEPLMAKKEVIKDLITDEINTKDDRVRFVEGLKKSLSINQKAAVIVPSIYSAQIVKFNPVNILKQESGLKVLSVTFLPLKYNSDDPTDLMYPCRVEKDPEGYGALGCAIQKRSSNLRGRKANQTGYVLVIDQQTDTDIFIYLQKIR